MALVPSSEPASPPMLRTRFGKTVSSSWAIKPNFKYFASGPLLSLKDTGRNSRSNQPIGGSCLEAGAIACSFEVWPRRRDSLGAGSVRVSLHRALARDATVRYNGSMDVFSLLSEVVIVASASHMPWRTLTVFFMDMVC